MDQLITRDTGVSSARKRLAEEERKQAKAYRAAKATMIAVAVLIFVAIYRASLAGEHSRAEIDAAEQVYMRRVEGDTSLDIRRDGPSSILDSTLQSGGLALQDVTHTAERPHTVERQPHATKTLLLPTVQKRARETASQITKLERKLRVNERRQSAIDARVTKEVRELSHDLKKVRAPRKQPPKQKQHAASTAASASAQAEANLTTTVDPAYTWVKKISKTAKADVTKDKTKVESMGFGNAALRRFKHSLKPPPRKPVNILDRYSKPYREPPPRNTLHKALQASKTAQAWAKVQGPY
jgi:hypothetical protein